MAKIGSLIASLGMNTANYKAGIKGAQSMTSRFSRDARKHFRRINNSVNGLHTALAGLAGAGSLTLLVKDAITTADEMEKLKRRLGASTEALSEMKFAAEQSGLQFRTLTMAMQRSQRRIAEAANDSGEAKDALKELGIVAQDLAKFTPDEQLLVLADALNTVENAGDRTRLAMKLFDSEGVAMLQMLQDGSAGILQLRNEARTLGLTLTDDAAVGAANANDALNRAKSVMKATALEIATNLAPGIEALANNFSATLPKGVNFAIDAFFAVRKAGLEVVSTLVDRYATFSYMVGELMEKVGLSDEADGAFGNASFLAQWAAKMRETAAATAAAQAEMKGFRASVKDIPVEPTDAVSRAMHNARANAIAATEAAKGLGSTIRIDIGDGSRNVFQQVGDNFRNMVNDMVSNWIASGLTDLFTGGALGFIGGALGIPGRESGGPVSAGRPYIVGEKRPELFVPSQSGTIIPSVGGGGVSIVNHFDFSGSNMNIVEVEQKIQQHQTILVNQIKESMKRGTF